jgi:hypothetical protein
MSYIDFHPYFTFFCIKSEIQAALSTGVDMDAQKKFLTADFFSSGSHIFSYTLDVFHTK